MKQFKFSILESKNPFEEIRLAFVFVVHFRFGFSMSRDVLNTLEHVPSRKAAERQCTNGYFDSFSLALALIWFNEFAI